MHTYHVHTCIHRCTHTHTTCSHANVTPLCLHILLCMNTSIKCTFMYSRFHNQTFCVLCLMSRSHAKDLVCRRTMNKMQRAILECCMQQLAYMILQNLFCTAAPFIVLSSSFTQRSLYETHTKGFSRVPGLFPIFLHGDPFIYCFFPIVLHGDLHVEK